MSTPLFGAWTRSEDSWADRSPLVPVDPSASPSFWLRPIRFSLQSASGVFWAKMSPFEALGSRSITLLGCCYRVLGQKTSPSLLGLIIESPSLLSMRIANKYTLSRPCFKLILGSKGVGVIFIKWTAVETHSPQNLVGKEAWSMSALATFKMWRCFLSTQRKKSGA
ncbi:hypothetical protein CRG98_020006 [Punica granatum]|uniref:Uncharacterized protein n=1 Tax=Punica granatum TaxID=22663 RepID=A0A2I0JTF1_PUNGR|nr:hypothetical protein CRG98_020006 [Punica granatum]